MKTPAAQRAEEILNDPAASDWLKNSVRTSLQRDPVDAVNDAEELAEFLAWRAKEQAAMALFELAQRSAVRDGYGHR